jgi:uncharacterized membrane protein YkoI
MNLKSILHRVSLAAMVLGLVGGVAVAAPTVSADQAAKIALARVPGKLMHSKLKKSEKQSKKDKKKKTSAAHDHYNIKIAPKDPVKGQWKRVEVDAVTGTILEVKDVKAKTYD